MNDNYIELSRNVIVKQNQLAVVHETEDSYNNYNRFKIKIDKLEKAYRNQSPINVSLLTGENNTNQEIVLDYFEYNKAREYIYYNYEELNEYYRSIIGLPPMSMTVKDLPLVESYYTGTVDKFITDLNYFEWNSIITNGHYDTILNMYEDKKGFQFLFFMTKDVDIIRAREAGPYDLIWWNTSNKNIFDFVIKYNMNKATFLRTFRNEFLEQFLNKYEVFIIMYLLMSTTLDVTINSALDRLNLDAYNEDEIKALLRYYGFSSSSSNSNFYALLLNNLKTVINYKGSDKLLKVLMSITGDKFDIVKYYIMKTFKTNIDISDDSIPDEDKYNLVFLKVPVNDDDPIKYMYDTDRIIDFDQLTFLDDRWDVANISDDSFKTDIIGKDMSRVYSKYIDVDFSISFDDLNKMTVMFGYLIMYGNMTDVTIDLLGLKFTLTSLVSYINALVFAKFGISDDIPNDVISVTHITTFDISNDAVSRIRSLVGKLPQNIRNTINFDNYISEDEINNIGQGDRIIALLQLFNDISIIRNQIIELSDYTNNDEDLGTLMEIYYILDSVEYNNDVFGDSTTYTSYLKTISNTSIYHKLKYITDKHDKDLIVYEIGRIVDALIEYTTELLTDSSEVNKALNAINKEYRDRDLVSFLVEVISQYKPYSTDMTNMSLKTEISDPKDNMFLIEQMKIKTHGIESDNNNIPNCVYSSNTIDPILDRHNTNIPTDADRDTTNNRINGFIKSTDIDNGNYIDESMSWWLTGDCVDTEDVIIVNHIDGTQSVFK